ncbi:MAG: hypothetical protein J0H66_02415 [Solirubrobacterales bacterium]|nr:hypothetical protein [Solirubrobacterales bacterium]OJU95307.1 MAG: hypothetical protein BGO23_05460 [Solirubrobacterales bacterium 67-14]
MTLLVAAEAQAANESVTAKTPVSPVKGSFYQSYPRPANLTIRADVTIPDSQALILPMKNTKITFPSTISFNPKKSMPACTDDKLNTQSPLGTPTAVLEACKDSVVGTGTSTIYLFKQKAHPLADPILIIFSAGRSASGNAKVKIYGFSKGTGVGILMTGELKNHVLDVAIPVLSYDSAVQYYQFDLPGKELDRPDIGIAAKGLDPSYVQATCPASGKLTTNADFILGERDASTGEDTGPETTVSSPPETQNCTGLKGKAILKASIKGPKAVKNGKKGTFKLTIKNNGTAVAKGVRVSAPGGKSGKVTIAAKASKTVKVKAKVSGKKGRKATVKFTIKGSGVSAKATAKVKVK